ncbi:MAG TPA: PaaI family thioesterase [Acidimicrobiales bacterium]|nr:PaaI family thioesterase [Acidimicrobiales bacterium]
MPTGSLQVPPNCDLTLGLTCTDKQTPGRSVWEMPADERFENPAGLIQGGFLAAMADSSMGAAAVTFAQGRRVSVANAELKVSFLAPVRSGTTLRCEAVVVAGGSRTAFVEASVTDADGRLVARASSTYLFRDRN